MIRKILHRLILGILIVFAVETATFFLMQMVPGGPFYAEKALPEQVKKNLMEKFGLDRPLHVQYFRYILMSLKFDFGPSMKYRSRNVRDIILSSFPTSLTLGALALLVAIITGLPAGIMAGVRSHKFSGRLCDAYSSLGISLPSFITAVFLVYFFSYLLKWLPPALWESPLHAILPVISLALPVSAIIARLVKEGVTETEGQIFLQAVKARGVSGARFILHLVRPSLASVLGIFGPVVAILITGSFVVEQIFSIPGLGRYFILSVINRDYPLIMGVTVFYCVVLVSANILSDILFFAVDPRSRGQAL